MNLTKTIKRTEKNILHLEEELKKRKEIQQYITTQNVKNTDISYIKRTNNLAQIIKNQYQILENLKNFY